MTEPEPPLLLPFPLFSRRALYSAEIARRCMEPERLDPPRPEAPSQTELRALVHLRDRVEAAAREVERLREENATLTARVAELQAGTMAPNGGIALCGEGDAEKLKAKIQGFIEAIDRVLSTPEPAAARRDA